MSRWTPRYVWTLHMVPGRLDGPPLAVRRRVLVDRDEVGHDIETPGGDTGVDFDELQEKGRARSYGSDRFPGTSAALRGEVAPPIAGSWWGRDLAIDVYDHNPTQQERAEWVARRKVEQAALRDLPRWVWVTRDGRRAGSLAARCPVDPEIGGMRRYDIGIRFGERNITIDLMGLVHAGRIDDGHTAPHVVYLNKPTAEQLRADGAERVRKTAEETRHRAEAEAFANAFRNAPATANGAPPPPPKPPPPTGPGPDAVRFFGLDPATATWPDVRHVWNERALAGHSDHGGKADLGELTGQKDAARAYIEARDAARAAPTGTR